MNQPRDIVDVASLKPTQQQQPSPVSLRGRPWLAIHFQCCRVYYRIYRNRRGDAYEGRCPRCQRPLRVPIGPDGTSNRFFEAT